jgi:anti-anti-sigma factor
MEITSQKSGDILVISLAGRLDASWCDSVEKALTAAVRDGEHHIHLDMEKVDYISSAGLRVLFGVYKQLLSIKGAFAIRNPSPNVRSVIQMVGIGSLIASGEAAAGTESEKGRTHASAQAEYEIFSCKASPFQLTAVGDESFLRGQEQAAPPVTRFDKTSFAIGVGALGTDLVENRARFGEFLAAGGAAAFQPADGSTRPDFVLSEGQLVPEGHLPLGLVGQGEFSLLVRFAARKESRTVGLSELAATALELAGTSAAALVAITETAGLVGASLRQSVSASADSGRFDFPQIRDWLSFSAERVFRDSTSLVAGVAAREGTPYQSLLRSHGSVMGHFHAAAFPYRPLQKGRIELRESVAGLFDTHSLQSVLHLLCDPREINGSGESEFFRGALWIAPINSEIENRKSKIP